MKLLKLLIGAEFAEKPAEGTDPTPLTLHSDSSGIGRCNRQHSIQFSRCQLFCKDVHGLSRPVDEPELFTLELLFTETTIFMNGYLRYRDGIGCHPVPEPAADQGEGEHKQRPFHHVLPFKEMCIHLFDHFPYIIH